MSPSSTRDASVSLPHESLDTLTTVEGPRISASERKRIFKQIIVKCVLQLLLIEMTNELLQNNEVYDTIPPEHLLRLMGVLDHIYQFARMFNEDKDLRTGLWKVGECVRLCPHCRAS